MGAVITISYAGNLTEYTWEGSAIQTVIPPMTDYTVSYSDVNGYSTPEPFSGKAMDGRVSEVIGTYNTELVTVNVSAEEGEVSGYEIQIISDGNVLYTQTTSSATYKFPYGTSYTIKASDISGYTAPSEQSFTASQQARNVDVVYKVIPFGVSIYDIDGNLTFPELWNTANNSKAVGVAILTDTCRFVVAKSDIGTKEWGGYGTDISTLTNYESDNDAATDFDGVNNTAKIIAAIGNSNDGYRDGTAAGDCAAYTFPNGKTGYLGAAGEWQVARQNKEDLNSALTLIGGTTMTESFYLTSTEYSRGYAWGHGFDSNSFLSCRHKYNYFDYVRAFTPYIANPKIISFTLYSYSKTIQCQAWDGTGHEQWERSAFNTTGKTGDDLHTFMGGWGTEWAAAEVLEDGKTYYFVEPL